MTIGVGGAVFEGSIQTQVVRAEPGEVLTWVNYQSRHRFFLTYPLINRLESPTRSLQIQAAQRVKLESLAGEMAATCYQDLRLKSTGGSVCSIDLFRIANCLTNNGQEFKGTTQGYLEPVSKIAVEFERIPITFYDEFVGRIYGTSALEMEDLKDHELKLYFSFNRFLRIWKNLLDSLNIQIKYFRPLKSKESHQVRS